MVYTGDYPAVGREEILGRVEVSLSLLRGRNVRAECEEDAVRCGKGEEGSFQLLNVG